MVWKNYLLTYDHNIMDVIVNYNFENKLCVVLLHGQLLIL